MSIPEFQPVRTGENVVELRQAVNALNRQMVSIMAALKTIGEMADADAATVVARVNAMRDAVEVE